VTSQPFASNEIVFGLGHCCFHSIRRVPARGAILCDCRNLVNEVRPANQQLWMSVSHHNPVGGTSPTIIGYIHGFQVSYTTLIL
ncbi:MAG: hypothetical protein VW307_09570, partial [Alphaproteobacteria bacterium]